jgi:hypothetical protein
VRDFARSVPRPPGQSRDYIVIEEFAHAGLTVELSVSGSDMSPRYCDLSHIGVVACAEPYDCLSDRDGDDGFVLGGDAALALLLAGPLVESSLAALEAHVVTTYGATVVVPLYLDENASCRTGLSVSSEPIGSASAAVTGVIFDRRGDLDTDGKDAETVRALLLREVRDYDAYLRGDYLIGEVRDEAGAQHWVDVTSDGRLDALRSDAKRAAKESAPEADLMRAQRRIGA